MAKKRKKMTLGDKITAVVFYSLILTAIIMLMMHDLGLAVSIIFIIVLLLIPSSIIAWLADKALESTKNQCYRDNDN